MFIVLFGRSDQLSLAELQSVHGDAVSPVGTDAALVDVDSMTINNLGGSIKIGRVLTNIIGTSWADVDTHLIKSLPDHTQYMTQGAKLKFGLSAYGIPVSTKDIQTTALSCKKIIKDAGINCRIIPNQSESLNAAQVLRNKLTRENGMELFFYRNGNEIVMAQTTAVQDIDAYAARDHGRPARDAKVGMLPPKLAQIMINLAKPESGVADIFCGTGVVLQEAMLKDFNVFGSDLSERMVEYSHTNLDWLYSMQELQATFILQQADATEVVIPKNIDTIVSEMYLGEPLHSMPFPDTLADLQAENEDLLLKTLENIVKNNAHIRSIVLAVPAWKQKSGFISNLDQRSILDSISKLGYTFVNFNGINARNLQYNRDDQIVARRLLVLRRQNVKD